MPSSTSSTTSPARVRTYVSNRPSLRRVSIRRVLLQFGAHRRAAVAGEIGQLHARLLDLAAQRDGSFGLRQPALPQDVVAVLVQRGHPRAPVRSSGAGLVAVDHRVQAGLPMRAAGFDAAHRDRPAAAGARRPVRPTWAHPDPVRPPRPPTARADSAAHVPRAAPGRPPARRASCGARRSSPPRR